VSVRRLHGGRDGRRRDRRALHTALINTMRCWCADRLPSPSSSSNAPLCATVQTCVQRATRAANFLSSRKTYDVFVVTTFTCESASVARCDLASLGLLELGATSVLPSTAARSPCFEDTSVHLCYRGSTMRVLSTQHKLMGPNQPRTNEH